MKHKCSIDSSLLKEMQMQLTETVAIIDKYILAQSKAELRKIKIDFLICESKPHLLQISEYST